jgi:hypothetical protein
LDTNLQVFLIGTPRSSFPNFIFKQGIGINTFNHKIFVQPVVINSIFIVGISIRKSFWWICFIVVIVICIAVIIGDDNLLLF